MKIFYKNHIGQTIDFMEWPYKISESDLYDYKWKYENRNSLTPKVTRFYRELVEKSINVAVSAKTLEAYHVALMHLYEVTERDILSKSPGRLYVGEEYLTCYIVGSQKTNWHPGVAFLTNTFSVVSESGAWILESNYSFYARGQADVDGQDIYMDYPYDHAYDYASVILAYVASNKGFSEADFDLTIIGPCSNPEITIAGHKYNVNCELESGELLRINSMTKKIYKVKVNGEQVNQFHLRNRESNVFQKIPEGNNIVTWDGSFSFNLTLFEGRSEPRWT